MRKASPQVAHQGLGELNQAFGDAAFVHHLACQHEERDGHQRKAVHTVVNITIKQGDVSFLAIQPQQDARRGEQAEEHRQTDHQEDEEDGKEPDQHVSYSAMISSSGGISSFRLSPPPIIVMRDRRISSMLTISSRTTPTSSEAIIHDRGMRIHSEKSSAVGR